MYKAFSADISRSYKQHLERILNKGVKTLIYQGQNAVKTNTAGVLNYMNTLEWTSAQRWK
jgi:carboxypeptidase C (cathepsin A)